MDESEIALQLLNLEITECKKQDLQKKLCIAENIVKRSEFDLGPIEDIDDVADLTGVSSEILEKVKIIEETNLQFQNWETERKFQFNDQFYNKIKAFLLNHYTDSHEIPTRDRILRLLIKTDEHSSEIRGHLNKFFTHLRLGTEGAIIVEKPATIIKRFHYFDTKLMYQKEDRNIVYIGGTHISRKNGRIVTTGSYGTGKLCLMAVSTKDGYISSLYTYRVDENAVKLWLFDEIVPVLPPGSVVIFCQKLCDEDKKPPNINVSKKEMADWLDIKDIPYCSFWHKAELYLLIENYKRAYHSEASSVTNYFSAKGHTVLQKPREVESSFYEVFWNHLRKTLTSKKVNMKTRATEDMNQKIMAIASLFSVKYWRNLETKLLEKELEEFKADMKMEVVIDKLLAYTKQEGVGKKVELDLDPFPKHLEGEYIFTLQCKKEQSQVDNN